MSLFFEKNYPFCHLTGSINRMMKLAFFRLLAKINKAVLPSYARKDLTKLSKIDKAIIGWRYWVTKRALGN